ncbi:MAG: type II toxin-antitoxin system HicA family toxin [Clostridia bacterium]|nr:type II toxin-antitoxin system HicA family toxin [Clostridia bacterium]
MSKKEQLLSKLFAHPLPKNFTKQELNTLMKKCNCQCGSGGRGSALKYYHVPTGRILIFDGPHPGNELFAYHIQKVREFLLDIGEANN